jgi:hypothetical protein
MAKKLVVGVSQTLVFCLLAVLVIGTRDNLKPNIGQYSFVAA